MEHCGKTVFYKNGRFWIQHENGVDCVLLDLSALRGRDGGRGTPGATGPAGAPGAQAFSFGHDTDANPDRIQVIVAPFTALTDGFAFEVENLGGPNTGLPFTLNLNGIADKAVVDSDGNPLTSNMLVNDTLYLFAYDGDNDRYQLLGLAKPGPEMCFEPGAGSESCQQINTIAPNNANGDHSIAMGSQTTTGFVATNGHAEGNGTLANAPNSHAEGDGTTARGANSHVEGFLTETAVTGVNSHAEGNSTQAQGADSHAEGQSSQAQGDQSHAEGISTISSGQSSHAEGQSTQAIGIRSHAEGNNTVSQGINSHSEGDSGQATGLDSHCEGRICLASGIRSHSQNEATQASGFGSHSGGVGASSGFRNLASGRASFNHSEHTAAQPATEGAVGDNSAILAGVNNDVDVASPRSVALGGALNKVVGEPDTAQAQHLRVKENFRVSTASGISAPLVAGDLVVANSNVVAGSRILLTHNTFGGAVGILSTKTATIIPGVSFRIESTSPTDTSTVNYLIINP